MKERGARIEHHERHTPKRFHFRPHLRLDGIEILATVDEGVVPASVRDEPGSIVSKRDGHPYQSWPLRDWRKIKCPEYQRL